MVQTLHLIVFFFLSQKRNGFNKISSVVTNMSWYLRHSIFSKRKSLSTAAYNLYHNFSFLPFDHKRYLKATNNCIHRFTRRILFDANRYTLVKRWAVFFFIKEKNGYTKTLSADANTSWCLPHSISSKWQSVSVATVNPIKDAFSIWL